MNGDEVRRLIFPRSGGGYDTAAVEELLDRVAAGLDAGRPVAPLIEHATLPRLSTWRVLGYPLLRKRGGYDYAAVDGVLAQLRRQDDPAARADPWRDLPAWHYAMASSDAAAADPAPAGSQAAAPCTARVQAAKDYERACADAWRNFGLPPGTQLSLVKTGAGRSELRTGELYPLVSAQWTLLGKAHAKALTRDGRAYKLGKVTAAQWPAVAAQISARQPGSPAHLPRIAPAARSAANAARPQPSASRTRRSLKSLADRTGLPVLYTSGRHSDRHPWGNVEFPGQRWLRFPVRGTEQSNAIMTAVDQAGKQVARYRIACPRVLGWRAIEITVHPDQILTDELILTLALTATWVSSFFESSGDGG